VVVLSWRERGNKIIDAVLEAVEKYCFEEAEEPVLRCIEGIGDDLYEVARNLYYSGHLSDVTEDDLRWLQNMPSDAYDDLNYDFSMSMDNLYNLVYEEISKICSDMCSESGASDEDHVRRCVERCVREFRPKDAIL
jgi:hypothetical protein